MGMGVADANPSANHSWPYVAYDSDIGLYRHFTTQWGVTCFFQDGDAGSTRQEGVRISAVFVVLFVSTAFTVLPVLATKQKKIKIPLYVYLFARYFGSGVITATAFIQ